MPLPHLAIERCFGIDLVLMHVDRTVQNLLDWFDQAWVRSEAAVRLVIGVSRKGGASDTALFAPHLVSIELVGIFSFLFQQCGLFRCKETG